jgi:predicted nucleotidyltransferase
MADGRRAFSGSPAAGRRRVDNTFYLCYKFTGYRLMDLKTKIPFDINMLSDFFKNQPVRKVYLFGSYARGDYGKESDVDFLVELERSVDLFRFIKIKLQLENLLQKTVDLISAHGLSNRIKPTIDSEKVLIYEK